MVAIRSCASAVLLVLACASCSDGDGEVSQVAAAAAPQIATETEQASSELDQLLKAHHQHQMMMRDMSEEEQRILRWDCAGRFESALERGGNSPPESRVLSTKLLGIYNSLEAWGEALSAASQLAAMDQDPSRTWLWKTAIAEAARHLNQAGQLSDAELIPDLEEALSALDASGLDDSTAAGKRVWLCRNLAETLSHQGQDPDRVRALFLAALETLRNHDDIVLAESLRMGTLSDFLAASLQARDEESARIAIGQIEASDLPSSFAASRVFRYSVFVAKGDVSAFWKRSKSWLETQPEPSRPVLELELNCTRAMFLDSENEAALALGSELLVAIDKLNPSSEDRALATLKSDAAVVLGRAALAEDHSDLVDFAYRAFGEAETALHRTGDSASTREGFLQFVGAKKILNPLEL